MLEVLLENGLLRIVDCGDSITFALIEDGEVVKQINWDTESVIDMLFIE